MTHNFTGCYLFSTVLVPEIWNTLVINFNLINVSLNKIGIYWPYIASRLVLAVWIK